MIQSRLSNLPTNFCFLYNGQPLDPNVEFSVRAAAVAITYDSQEIVLIDNIHCNIGPELLSDWIVSGVSSMAGQPQTKFSAALAVIVTVLLLLSFCCACIMVVAWQKTLGGRTNSDEQVPIMTTATETYAADTSSLTTNCRKSVSLTANLVEQSRAPCIVMGPLKKKYGSPSHAPLAV